MTNSIELVEKLFVICRNKQIIIRVAESCTGGLLSSFLTKLPGSSKYFDCGIVAYSNIAKHLLLNVPLDVIDRYGAVSAETALLMVEHLSMNHQDQCLSIATTGFCGPRVHQSDDLGVVYIAIHYNHKTCVEKFRFGEDRQGNIDFAVQAALNMAIQALIEW